MAHDIIGTGEQAHEEFDKAFLEVSTGFLHGEKLPKRPAFMELSRKDELDNPLAQYTIPEINN
ncbi:hypothetical protein [Pontimonas salivibrio]|uniref:hypothetical protein n=1 Tax=Pontimonas salivibrio TaxID=1159327 RepID=UPI001319FD94|nr:hypothetical protein [Pontimonas salivibrio]